MMFKLLFLKKLYDLSDEALISSAQTDMAYKFFLEPEAKMIDPSLLTKFRKTRITEDILEKQFKNHFWFLCRATEIFTKKPNSFLESDFFSALLNMVLIWFCSIKKSPCSCICIVQMLL